MLDIGIGTAILSHRLYDNGHSIDGLDFSAKMIEIAQAKMPKANVLECDFSAGLPKEIKEKKYDFIVSTYALHHLNDDEKLTFIKELLPLITDNGKIFIGDIAFQNRDNLDVEKKVLPIGMMMSFILYTMNLLSCYKRYVHVNFIQFHIVVVF